MEAANQAVEEEVKVVREELILKRRLPEMLQTLCCGSATRSAGIGQGEFFLRPTDVVCLLFVVCCLLFVAGWLFVCCWVVTIEYDCVRLSTIEYDCVRL